MESITVFTPSYNRAKLLPRCYESLKRQTCKDFVWMIIDDGSTDGTKELVAQWLASDEGFRIEYYFKDNGGLHTAYNEAIAHIETPLSVCIDSDDFMPDDAVEKILTFWRKYGSDRYAGIVGLDCYLNGDVIGDLLPNQKSVNLIDLLTGKYHIRNGDRTNVVRTELYKKYAPMKSYPGEKNYNPHYLHLQISKEYNFLVLNENLRFVEYQEGGMSNSIIKQYKNSPKSFADIRVLYLSFPGTSLLFRFRHSVHLVSSCYLSGKLTEAIHRSPHKFITTFSIPMGILLGKYIKWKG